MTHITVVVPLLNEDVLVSELIKRIDLSLRNISEDYKILLVDDGSIDETWKEIKNQSLQKEQKNKQDLSDIDLNPNKIHYIT